jgi:hypothetical protein
MVDLNCPAKATIRNGFNKRFRVKSFRLARLRTFPFNNFRANESHIGECGVLEMLEVPGMEAEDGEVISLADWSDADFTKLATHRPEPTGLVIRLKEARHRDCCPVRERHGPT